MDREVLAIALVAFTLTVSAVSGRNYLTPVVDFLHAHGRTLALVAVFLAFLTFLMNGQK